MSGWLLPCTDSPQDGTPNSASARGLSQDGTSNVVSCGPRLPVRWALHSLCTDAWLCSLELHALFDALELPALFDGTPQSLPGRRCALWGAHDL